MAPKHPKTPKLDANAIPWKEFLIGYRVAMSALMGEGAPPPVQMVDDAQAAPLLTGTPGDVPANVSPDAIVPPGAVISPEVRAKLEKDPYSRVLLALRDHFGPGYPYYRPFLYRFWSLYDLVHRKQLPEFAQAREDGTLGLHPALLLAAADVKLTKKGKLPLNRFRDRVMEIIARELEKAGERSPAGPLPLP